MPQQRPWWYVLQKILPHPEQLQADAPTLLVPAQLVVETDEEVVMVGTRGMPDPDDDDEDGHDIAIENTERLHHGVLRRDTLVEYPLIRHHQDVSDGAISRLAEAWSHDYPKLTSSLAIELEPQESREVPSQLIPVGRRVGSIVAQYLPATAELFQLMPYPEMSQLYHLDRVPSGEEDVLSLVTETGPGNCEGPRGHSDFLSHCTVN